MSNLLVFSGLHLLADEQAALYALRHFHKLDNGYHLVPEHIETRALYRPDKLGIKQVCFPNAVTLASHVCLTLDSSSTVA